METIDASTVSADPREVVWGRIADIEEWPVWGPWSSVEIEGGGEHGPDAIRVLKKWPLRIRERVIGWEPGSSMRYELVGGLKIEGYVAEVRLVDRPDGGTEVRWHSEYLRGGVVATRIVRAAVPDVCRRVAAG
jgi:hypothetical protein